MLAGWRGRARRRLEGARPRLAATLFQGSDALLGRRGPPRAVISRLLPLTNRRTRYRRLLPIVWLEDRPPLRQLDESRRGIAAGPNIDGRPVTADVTLPPVRLYEFTGVRVVGGSSVFESQRDVTIENVPGIDTSRCSFLSGALFAQGRHVAALVKRPGRHVRLQNGFFLSGYGSWNYYHWMIEVLPKLAYWHTLPPELRAYPFLVGPEVDEYPSLLEALAFFCDDADIEVLRIDVAYSVDHLLHINAPSTCPINLRADVPVRVTDFLIRPGVIHDWRERVGLTPETARSRKSGAASASSGRRLFLARSGAHRAYNEEELLPVFLAEEFEPIYLERMTLREQIDALSSAAFVAGPTGAAWTNLIFCAPGTRGLCWLPEQSTQFSAFSTIASIVGVDLRYLTYRAHARSTSELYFASYRLEVADVERALAALLAV